MPLGRRKVTGKRGLLLTPSGISQSKEEAGLPCLSQSEARTGEQEILVEAMLKKGRLGGKH